jgi:hypothetical protein
MAAAGTAGRALRHMAFQFRMQQVVPVLRLRHAQALQHLGLIHQAIGLEHRAGPVAFRIFQIDRPRLADGRGNRVQDRLGHVEARQQILRCELVEQRALAAPENIDLGPALPFEYASVGHRRPRRERARLQRDIPGFLRILGEIRQRRVGQRFRDRCDQNQFIFDGLRHGETRCQRHRGKRECKRFQTANHVNLLCSEHVNHALRAYRRKRPGY